MANCFRAGLVRPERRRFLNARSVSQWSTASRLIIHIAAARLPAGAVNGRRLVAGCRERREELVGDGRVGRLAAEGDAVEA